MKELAEERPSAVLTRMVNGYQVSQAIHVAAVLGIADLLKDGPRSSDDLAAATGTHPGALYRLLRALAGAGVFMEEDDRRFALTALAEPLCYDSADPVAPWAILIGRPYRWEIWGNMLYSVRTGQNAARHVLGMSSWEYRALHPEEGAIFDAAMTAGSLRHASAVLDAYDFGRFRTVVDVAGGHGAFLAAILAAHPALRGVLFDQPHVVAGAEPLLRSAGVAERCQVVGGSFFDAVPQGGDAYILKFILHDWEDEEALAILRACRKAIAPGGRLVVVERVLPPPNEGAEAKFSDLNMLLGPGGQERTSEEYAALFASAGLRLEGITATASVVSVIEAVPVPGE